MGELNNMVEEALKYLAASRWTYLAYFIPGAIITIWFYLKNKGLILYSFKNFIIWLKSSMEAGGQSSPEKIMFFVVALSVYVPSRIMYCQVVDQDWYLLLGNILDVVFMLLLVRIVTPANIIELKNGMNGKDLKNDDKPSV